MVAERMHGVAESPTVALSSLVAEMRGRGEDVLSLAVGQPDFPTPDHIVRAAKEALDRDFTKYTPSLGIPELREAIAEKSRRENGIPCGPEHVLVSSTKHALFATTLALAGPGDEVLVPDPGWVSYEPMVRMAGARPVPVPCPEAAGAQMDANRVAEAVTPATRMVLVNTPNNPTGSVYDEANLRGIADLAEDHDFVVVTDEIYERILYEGTHHSVASFPGAFPRTITVNGFSKTYAMTGWRLGWVVAPTELLAPINTIQQHSFTCATSFAQVGGVAALQGPQEPVDAMIQEYRHRRDLLMAGLKGLPLRCEPPRGSFYAWVAYEDDRNSVEFAEMLLEKAGLAVTPGAAFGAQGEDHLRLSFATSRENLQEALRRLERVLA